MNKIVTPLSFLKVDDKLEGRFPVVFTEPTRLEISSAICYEEIVAWPPEDSKDTGPGRTNLKTRFRLA